MYKRKQGGGKGLMGIGAVISAQLLISKINLIDIQNKISVKFKRVRCSRFPRKSLRIIERFKSLRLFSRGVKCRGVSRRQWARFSMLRTGSRC